MAEPQVDANDPAYKDYQDYLAYHEYLQKHAAESASPSLGQKIGDAANWVKENGQALTYAGLSTLPTLGTIAGGIIGAPSAVVTGPVGPMTAAGLGNTAGEELKRAGEKYLLGLPVEEGNTLERTAKEFGTGAIQELGGQVAGKAIGTVASGVASNAPKVLSALNIKKLGIGVKASSEALETFAKRAKVVEDMSKSANGNVAAAADTLKQGLKEDLKNYFDATNKSVGDVLEKAGPGKTINPKTALDSLDTAIAEAKSTTKLGPDQAAAKIKNLQDIKDKMMAALDKEGNLPVSAAHEMKKDLWQRGFEQTGNITQEAKAAGHALNEEIGKTIPAVKELNAHQKKVYDLLDKSTPKTALGNKPELAFLPGGSPSAANGRPNLELGQLGQQIGSDLVGQGQDLVAMKAITAKGAPLMNKAAGRVAQGLEAINPSPTAAANIGRGLTGVVRGTGGIRDIEAEQQP